MSRKSFAAVILLILTGCQTNQPADQAKKGQLHLKLGTSHLAKGNYPAALGELQKARRYDPDNPVVYNNLGLAYLVRGRYQTAEVNLRKAIKLEPGYTEARNNLGRVLLHQNRVDDAVSELKVAVDDLTFPSPEKSHSNLGIAYFMQKNFQDAEDHLKRSLVLRREHCTTQNYYGRTLYEQKLYKKSMDTLESSIEICDKQKFYEPRYYSALAAFQLGFREQSRAKFEEILHLSKEGKYVERSKEMLRLLIGGRKQ
ncbi:MAG: hypothetical protein CL677_00020 [Bdellovibrionaceae bacterium]|nr:hypothetical protein [Pseudobdellovibrionaceae bacterium]|tara:strand:- start:35884 stop:36651 length:768 start_codon:yes stop_codon:yes gene_type:complete